MKIGVIDSGRGGLYIKEKLQKLDSSIEVINYIPPFFRSYGSMSIEQLEKECDTHIKYLKEKDVNIIVVGCMTLSTNCLKYIKSISGSTVVLDLYTCLPKLCEECIAIFATPKTIESGKFNEMKRIKCDTLARVIEKDMGSKLIRGMLRGYERGPYIKGCHGIILGCSHYFWAEQEFSDVYYLPIINPCNYLIEKVKKLL